jgi:RNA polymerase sigma-70 factor (ECF subfamily)
MRDEHRQPDEYPQPGDPGFDLSGCLAKVRQGDELAAQDLVRQFYPLVVHRIRLCRPKRTSEEDLAQMIFIKMFNHLDQYSGHHPFEHWLTRIALNTCLTQVQREKRRPECRWADLAPEEAGVLENLAAMVPDQAEANRMAARELVEKLLEELPPNDQLLMRLLYLEERTLPEIQEATGWSSVGVRVKAFRARRKLKARLAQLLQEDHR